MTTRPAGPSVPGPAAARSSAPDPPTRRTRTEGSAVPETARLAPLGTAHRCVAVWAMPGREPGQTRNLRHLTWSGPGDYVHLCYGGVVEGDVEYPGEDMGRVSGRCPTFKQAQAAVDAYVSRWRI